MSVQSHNQDPVLTAVLQDPADDKTHEQPHDQATEVAHAWHHFHENVRFFACFLSVILLTVAASNINFGSPWNTVAIFFFAAARSALIAYFMASMFKSFSFIRSTFFFCAIFLAGMIFLSWWDSELKGIGDPIKDRRNHPALDQ